MIKQFHISSEAYDISTTQDKDEASMPTCDTLDSK